MSGEIGDDGAASVRFSLMSARPRDAAGGAKAEAGGGAPTLRSGLETARNILSAAGIADARVEAEVLARFVIGWERDRFLTEVYARETRFPPDAFKRLRSLANRRLGGEPLAYIVGTREFYGLSLRVDERVLIPRQETELLVEIALEELSGADATGEGEPPPLAIDVGTGSGAIALAVAAVARSVRVVAGDVSGEALALARRNAAALGLANRIGFVRSDLLAALRGSAALIVSNPPYIPSGDMAGLQAEIKREPRIALDGGADGLATFRRLARQAGRRLAPGGALIVELAPELMDAAETIAAERIPRARRISRRKDLFGDDRALVVKTA